MAEEINRLYWLGRNGLWKLVMERQSETLINVEVRRKMGASMPVGVKGYSKIHGMYSDGPKTFWYEHVHCRGSFARSIVEESEVPKPILMLELLCE